MSILFDCDIGCFISTEKYINGLTTHTTSIKINENLFKICSPYSFRTAKRKTAKKNKSVTIETNVTVETNKIDQLKFLGKDILDVKKKFLQLLPLIEKEGILFKTDCSFKNDLALKTAEEVYEKSGKHLIKNTVGVNMGPAILKIIQDSRYLFPQDCIFFSKEVDEIQLHLQDKLYDLILLDPPWWNKYIRRKRKKCPHAYKMMYDVDLSKISVQNFLSHDGIVAVWCTNSPSHLETLINDIFPKWGVQYVGKWFWLKVTMSGEPICAFSEPPGKQPFEQIIFGFKNPENKLLPTNGKLLLSIPSSIHSHKPPLVDVLQPFLPQNPKCLEIFARYLLPKWTSYGNEVLRFQHESLYTFDK